MTAEVRSSLEEIKAALARAEEHLAAAQVLCEKKFYNDAISRVYYGFFEAASAALLTKGLIAKTHHGLSMLFDREFIKPGAIEAGIGRWFERARVAREEADYERMKHFSKEQVETALTAARQFLEVVKTLISAGKAALE